MAAKQLVLIRAKLDAIHTSVRDLDGTNEDNICALEECRDQVIVIKAELSKMRISLLSSEAKPDDPVMKNQAHTDKFVFDCLLTIKKCLRTSGTPPDMSAEQQ